VPKERVIDIAIDFLTINSRKTGPETFMIILDRLTKFTALIPCYKDATTTTFAYSFLGRSRQIEIQSLHQIYGPGYLKLI
jgi:hypothetical protein